MARRSGRHPDRIDLSAALRNSGTSRAATAYGLTRLAVGLAWTAAWRRPGRQSAAERLASLPQRGLPVGAPVDIRWNGCLVPFIEAASDRDLATALGLVHAHLRLAQMEMMRRIARGRLAEAVGAVAVRLDHGLRLIDLPRAVPAILAGLPDATRDWLDGFVAGINHHLAAAAEPPHELRLLGIAAAPWRVEDVLAIARLAAADVHWLLWARLLRRRGDADWPADWARLVAHGTVALAGTAADGNDAVERGSNALAVAGRRSASGAPWLAGDPHLPLTLPSVWLQAAYRSPSYNLAGLMIPGIPVMAIGRNRHLAWGGTNLHAASSDLFDVSALPASAITKRRVRIAVRWSRPREVVLRDTPHGPIVSDLPLFPARHGETLAMRWIGHLPSDEITALLAINRATDAASFRAAAANIAVPGQMLVFAERTGGIGRLPAAWLPRRPPHPPADLVAPLAAASDWERLAASPDLSAEVDPPCGFVVSANDRPAGGEIPFGWFFSPGDRAARLAARLRACERIGFADLAAILGDVAAPTALELRDRLCAELVPPPRHCPVFAALAAWDGAYNAESAGALAFELVVAQLIAATVPESRRATFGAVWHARQLLTEELGRIAPEHRTQALRTALRTARPQFRRLRRWGGAHRLRLMHPLGRLPLLRGPYRALDWPWPGSNETLLKSAHGPVIGRHAAGYGSNARYVFDLADPDGNRLVLLGGQDGAPGSAAFRDQAALFRRGEYIDVPLRPETARARFAHRTLLTP